LRARNLACFVLKITQSVPLSSDELVQKAEHNSVLICSNGGDALPTWG